MVAKTLAMAAEFEARSPARPPRSSTAARYGDVLESDFSAGVAEALEHGFLIPDLERLRSIAEGEVGVENG